MQIKKSQVEPLIAAILALDAEVVLGVDFDKDGKERKTIKRIILSGYTRYRLSKNLRVLKAEAEIITDTRDKLFRQRDSQDNPVGTLTGRSAIQFQRDLGEVLRQEVDLPLIEIPITDFEMGDNPVPLAAMEAMLGCIITGDMPPT